MNLLLRCIVGLIKTIGLTMIGVGIGSVFAPDVDVITESKLPPFYTA